MPQKAKPVPVGSRYGKLRVIGRDFLSKDKNAAYWLCQCDCGNIASIAGSPLRRGGRSSCGCGQANYFRLRPYESLYNFLVDRAKRTDRKVMTYEEFLEFTKVLFCSYCGSAVSWSEYNLRYNGLSYNLDRVDNSKGYLKNNCVVCCSICNTMKSDLKREDFIGNVIKIANNQVGAA
jgi:hypothetical protein